MKACFHLSIDLILYTRIHSIIKTLYEAGMYNEAQRLMNLSIINLIINLQVKELGLESSNLVPEYVILVTILLHNKKQFGECNYIHRYLK